MRIAIGCDHRGYDAKTKLVQLLGQFGHEVVDVGTNDGQSVDYPDYAAAVGQMVVSGEAERGILICGTGIGMAIAANKIDGIRAAACSDEITAELSRRHNDVNVLCLSGDMLGERRIDRMVEVWLTAEFEGGRHARRIDKVNQLEQNEGCG